MKKIGLILVACVATFASCDLTNKTLPMPTMQDEYDTYSKILNDNMKNGIEDTLLVRGVCITNEGEYINFDYGDVILQVAPNGKINYAAKDRFMYKSEHFTIVRDGKPEQLEYRKGVARLTVFVDRLRSALKTEK